MDIKSKIFLSTGGYHGKSAYEACLEFEDLEVRNFELSAGSYSETLLSDLMKLHAEGWSFKLHNYFPPPKVPFVLNLASCRDDILERSIQHCKQAIDWSAKLGSNVYGVHAGYLIDPNVSELGKKIAHRVINPRDQAISRFLDALKDVSDYAKLKDVTLLIENNVLSAENFESFDGENPLLMVDTAETEDLSRRFPENVRLLIDVAHLKVSSHTLGFDPVGFFDRTKERTVAYHLSDNNSLEDSNEPFNEKSYFFKHLKRSSDILYYSLEVYAQTPDGMCKQRDIAATKLMGSI